MRARTVRSERETFGSSFEAISSFGAGERAKKLEAVRNFDRSCASPLLSSPLRAVNLGAAIPAAKLTISHQSMAKCVAKFEDAESDPRLSSFPQPNPVKARLSSIVRPQANQESRRIVESAIAARIV